MQHEPSSLPPPGHRRYSRPSVEDLQTLPRTASVHPVHGRHESQTLRFLLVGRIARDTLDDFFLALLRSVLAPESHRLGYSCRSITPGGSWRPPASTTRPLSEPSRRASPD